MIAKYGVRAIGVCGKDLMTSNIEPIELAQLHGPSALA